jgi:inner membrane protein
MASLGHVAVGIALGRALARPAGGPGAGRGAVPAMVALSLLALAPDLDVVAFSLGVPYADPFGHRGASHSLAAALAAAAVAALAARARGLPALRVFAAVAVAVGSHGPLDALTDGGLGAALLWPFSDERFFAPVQPLPVAPIGVDFLSPRGAYCLAVELAWFSPLLAWALWPRRPPRVAHGDRR